MTVLTTSLAQGEVGRRYLAGLNVSGGIPPYSFRLVSGSLAPGLTLRANTRSTTGVPTAAGAFSFRVEATSSGGSRAQKNFGIIILK